MQHFPAVGNPVLGASGHLGVLPFSRLTNGSNIKNIYGEVYAGEYGTLLQWSYVQKQICQPRYRLQIQNFNPHARSQLTLRMNAHQQSQYEKFSVYRHC